METKQIYKQPLNESEQKLQQLGYALVGNRDLTGEETDFLRSEATRFRIVSLLLWLISPACFIGMLIGLLTLGTSESRIMGIGISFVAVLAVAVVVGQALMRGQRSAMAFADSKGRSVAQYERPSGTAGEGLRWTGLSELVTRLELLVASQRVWSVNGQPDRDSWDALR